MSSPRLGLFFITEQIYKHILKAQTENYIYKYIIVLHLHCISYMIT